MQKFPSDQTLEKITSDVNVDTIIAMASQLKGMYEARRRLAELVTTLRGHVITNDNTEVLPQGVEARCDRCGMKLLVPKTPKPDELGIYGRATELNCPAARRNSKASGYADMPVDLYEKLLIKVAPQKPWEQPTSFTPEPDRSEEVKLQERLDKEIQERFKGEFIK